MRRANQLGKLKESKDGGWSEKRLFTPGEVKSVSVLKRLTEKLPKGVIIE